MNQDPSPDLTEPTQQMFDGLGRNYLAPLYHYIKANPELIKTFPGLLLKPDQMIFYYSRTHLAIEYSGPPTLSELPTPEQVAIRIYDFTQSDADFFEGIIGFNFNGSNGLKIQLRGVSEDLILPTDAGFDKLLELHWSFDAQNSVMGINVGGLELIPNQFARIVNGLFFNADEQGLKTRYIQWMDFIPLIFEDIDEESDGIAIDLTKLAALVPYDAHYKFPLPPADDYKYSKLPQLNRFIELISSGDASEPVITKFLEQPENRFILSMAFLCQQVLPQLHCEWQSEVRNSIIPDFFVVKANGYGDIVEFKLPSLKSNLVVGSTNRETFSAEIHSYIAQTRVYKTYFEDPNNRAWFQHRFGFEVHYPKRTIVIGRRWDFSVKEWKEISNEFNNFDILTYDDIIDGVKAQFYL